MLGGLSGECQCDAIEIALPRQRGESEPDRDLRTEAIRSLGLMGSKTAPTLKTLYAGEKSAEVKGAVLHAFFVQGNAAALVEIARQERDPALKRDAVRMLSMMQSKEATDYLLELLK